MYYSGQNRLLAKTCDERQRRSCHYLLRRASSSRGHEHCKHTCTPGQSTHAPRKYRPGEGRSLLDPSCLAPEAPCTQPRKTQAPCCMLSVARKPVAFCEQDGGLQENPRKTNQRSRLNRLGRTEIIAEVAPRKVLADLSCRRTSVYAPPTHVHAIEVTDTRLSHVHPTTHSPGLFTPVCYIGFGAQGSPGVCRPLTAVLPGGQSAMRSANVLREGWAHPWCSHSNLGTWVIQGSVQVPIHSWEQREDV